MSNVWATFVFVALVGTGCAAQTTPPADPGVVVIHITAVHPNGTIIANTIPPPEAAFGVHIETPTLQVGATLTCEVAGPILKCEDNVIEFIGCHVPEAAPPPDMLHVEGKWDLRHSLKMTRVTTAIGGTSTTVR